MRNKVISVITVIIVYVGVFFWSLLNSPINDPLPTIQIWAWGIFSSFAALGLWLSLYTTIKWLCAKGDA